MSGDMKELSFFGEPCFFLLRLCGLRGWDLNQKVNVLLKCGLRELYHSHFYWLFQGGTLNVWLYLHGAARHRVTESLPFESQLSCMMDTFVGSVP